MKPNSSKKYKQPNSAMTVIELTLTLSLMLSFATITILSLTGMKEWKLARLAGEELRGVYLAQKSFLADHPVVKVADITSDDMVPYLPGNKTSVPLVESLDGTMLVIDFKTMPPVVRSGTEIYDPSGKPADSLWDAGVK